MRYIYGGMKLKDYCKINNIDYIEISNRIKSITEQGYKLSGKEMLDIVLNDDAYHSFVEPTNKYFYNGILLSDYCSQNDINYRLIVGRIYSLKKSGVKEDDVVNIALNNELFYTQSKKYKYLYKDTTLMKYCKDNGYNYLLMLRRYQRLKTKYPDKTDEEIYEIVFDEKLYFQTVDVYKYNGITLSKYCDENDLEYSNIIRRAKKARNKDSKLSMQDAIDEAVKHYEYLSMKKRNSCRYYYQGVVLKKYCESNDINYNMIIHRIKKLRLINEDLSNNELTQIALNEDVYDNYVIDQYRKSRYYYNGIPLKIYCENSMLDYHRIIMRIRLLKGKVAESNIVETALDDDKYHSLVNERRVGKYHLYKGYTLKKYCKLNGLEFIKVYEEVCKIAEQTPEMPNEEVIELAINRQNEEFALNERIQEIRRQKEILNNMKKELLSNNKTEQNKELIKK